MARQRSFNFSRTRPKYKWCGFGQTLTVATVANTTVSEVIQLCPRLLDEDAQGDVTVEAIYAHIGIRRLLFTAVAAMGYIIDIQKSDDATGNPLKVLDTVPIGAAATVGLGNRDILQHGLLPVVSRLIDGSSGAAASSNEVEVVTVEYKARRKLHRLTHGVYMHITADSTDVMAVVVSGRLLLRYS